MSLTDIGKDGHGVALYDYHHSMLLDSVRVEAYLRAILNTVRPGDVVVDIGTGTGLLALFAAAAGAKRVYAIEHEPIVDVAMEVARVNGVADRIEFVVGRSTEVEIPEPGDVLVTETIGNAGFDEGILTWVADARARLLKPDARLIPSRLNLMGSLLELPRDHAELEKLSSRLYSFDLSPLRRLAVNKLAYDEVSPVSVVAEPAVLIEAELRNARVEVSGNCVLVVQRDATVHAVGAWFDALIGEGVSLSNAPPGPAPSWHQGLVMLDEPLQLVAGDEVHVAVKVLDDGGTWEFQVEPV